MDVLRFFEARNIYFILPVNKTTKQLRELEISAIIFWSDKRAVHFSKLISVFAHCCCCCHPAAVALQRSSLIFQSLRDMSNWIVCQSLSGCGLASLQLDMFIACHKSSSSRIAHSLRRPLPLPLPLIALHVLRLRKRRCKHRVGASIFTLISFEALQSSSIS